MTVQIKEPLTKENKEIDLGLYGAFIIDPQSFCPLIVQNPVLPSLYAFLIPFPLNLIP